MCYFQWVYERMFIILRHKIDQAVSYAIHSYTPTRMHFFVQYYTCQLVLVLARQQTMLHVMIFERKVAGCYSGRFLSRLDGWLSKML